MMRAVYRVAIAMLGVGAVFGASCGGGRLPLAGAPEGLGGSPVVRIELARSGRYVATELANGAVGLWESASGRLLHAQQGAAPKLAFDPDGRTVAVAHGKALRFLRLDTAEQVRAEELPNVITRVTWSESGRAFAVITGGQVRVWPCSRDHEGGPFVPSGDAARIPSTTAHDIAIGPRGRLLAVVDAAGALALWDLWTARRARLPEGGFGRLVAARFAPSGLLVLRDAEGRVFAGEPSATLQQLPANVGALTFAPGGAAVLELGMEARALDALPDGLDRCTAMAFERPDRLVRIHEDGEVSTLALSEGREMALPPGRPGRVVSLAVSSDGRHLAGLYQDGVVRLWRDVYDPGRDILVGDGARPTACDG